MVALELRWWCDLFLSRSIDLKHYSCLALYGVGTIVAFLGCMEFGVFIELYINC
jgi:hypothetical protein